MAKTKYTEEVVQVILDTLRETGSDKAAYQSAAIGKATYFAWQARHPDFQDQIAQAKQDYRDTCPDVLRRQARKAFVEYLFGRVEETWTTEETITMGDRVVTKITTRRVRRGTPVWAIDRVLGKQIPLLEAMQLLLTEGVATPEQAETVAQGIANIEQSLKTLNVKAIESEPERGDRLEPPGSTK